MPFTTKPRLRVPAWLVLVAAMVAVGPISVDMYLPAFTVIGRELAANGIEVTLSVYLIGVAISQLVFGPLSDRFGRKRPLYFGYALYVLGATACAFSTNMPMLIGARLFQAIGAGAGTVIASAIIRDRCRADEAAQAFSIMASIAAIAPIMAPVLGGVVVATLGWRAVFAFQVLLGVAVVIAAHRLLRETRPAHAIGRLSVGSMARDYARLAANRELLGYSLMGGAYMGAIFAYISGAPTVLTQTYGLSPPQFGMLFGLNGLAFILANQLNIAALRKLTAAELLARYSWMPLGLVTGLWVLATLWQFPLWLMVAFQIAFFLAVGGVSANVVAIALAPHGNAAGSASALLSTIYALLPMASGVAVAVCNDGSIAAVAGIMTASAGIAFAGYLWALGGSNS